jgi:exonuclease III
MKILFWNIRGLGASGRRNQLRELRKKHKVAVICLQETIKADFSIFDLNALSEGSDFEWSWTAAVEHSGGTLTGVNLDDARVVMKDNGEFFSSLGVITRDDNFQWEIIYVYGPVHTERKSAFLQELNQKMLSVSWPIVMGGDFNLIRFSWEKSSDNCNQFWMDAFNKFILDNGLLELPRFGSKYTWTNKQLNPVMSVLDRVLVCNLFNSHYREASCDSISRVGSDHNPLIVDTKDSRLRQQYNFRFEPLWLEQQGFKDMLKSKWPERMGRPVQDFWKEIKCATRKFCRGWSVNFQIQLKKNKKSLLDKIAMIDRDSHLRELDVTQWQTRYNLEAELEQIYSLEELQLKRQSGIKWILKGDANNSFFHGAASGRWRRGSIFYIEENGEEIRDPGQLRILVDNFYKELFCEETMGGIRLGSGFWRENCKLSEGEAAELVKPFTMKEVEDALKEMNASSAPGPDGFPVGFYRAFWPEIKETVMEMFAEFHRGTFNLSRLNFGMISLIPKMKEANNIRQFRRICVLDIDYKWFTKVLTIRLTPFSQKIINNNQTTFIPGRLILEGMIILHEILHELRVTKTKGIVLKLGFEKAYDKVH